MLAKSRHVTLHGKCPRHADISVLGTCMLEVNIQENHNQFKAEFEELCFIKHSKETELVCKHRESTGTEKEHWHLKLDNEDAFELEHLIEQAEDEFEALMNDL